MKYEFAKSGIRTGTILTVMLDEIPAGHKHIDFFDLDITKLGIPMKDIDHAEIIRVVNRELTQSRILKDRYGYRGTTYQHS